MRKKKSEIKIKVNILNVTSQLKTSISKLKINQIIYKFWIDKNRADGRRKKIQVELLLQVQFFILMCVIHLQFGTYGTFLEMLHLNCIKVQMSFDLSQF